MKKGWKTAVIVLIVLLVLGGAVGGYFIWRHQTSYIGGDKALQTALDSFNFFYAVGFKTQRSECSRHLFGCKLEIEIAFQPFI